ncbi:MAG: PorP/SprF family type IX secretion system membrane protein [Flavobacteriales bacterium]|nr:PorP/SprF family type IX secretion system membrane protein [Flavobacteriales bacterium]
MERIIYQTSDNQDWNDLSVRKTFANKTAIFQNKGNAIDKNMKDTRSSWLAWYSIICLVFVVVSSTVQSQDVHFSQFSQTPLLVNPALTGLFRGDNRATLHYKNQWKSIGAPFKTYALSYDMSILKNKWDQGYLGVGFYAFSDKAGDSQLSTTQMNLSVSGIVAVDDANTISLGLQGGFAQRSINSSALQWGNQFDKGNFDASLASQETNVFSPFTHGDFSAGLNWHYVVDKLLMTNAGIALYHVNNPRQEFITSSSEQLYSKIVGYIDGQIGLSNNNLSILPSILYLNQGPATELTFGAMLRYRLKEESRYTGYIKETALSFGGHYRNGDSFIPSILLEVANYALGISYDINVSKLNTVSSGRGGVEISLRFVNPNPLRRGGSKQGPSFL